MRYSAVMFRLTAASAVAGMLTVPCGPVMAQGDTTTDKPSDPPALVGRVASLLGTVSYHGAGQDQWQPATLNFPVTSGDAFWTQPAASADLGVSTTRVTLDQSTEFDIATLDEANFIATVPQGEVYLRVNALAPGAVDQVRTPRGVVTLAAPGRYAITAGDTDSPTLVTVETGSAEVTGQGVSLRVGAHQTAQISGADTFQGSVGAEAADPFLQAQLVRDRPPRFANRIEAPPVVAEMTGYEAVADTGSWVATADYGRVWYPPVEPNWVPYRHGRWSYVAPWGWTWVDDASWGFAPFHYGRWVEIDDRWAWTPVVPGVAYGRRPIYAPALVSFVGLGVGVGVGVGIGASVGWIPLGPREVYRPPYRVSDNYIRNLNVTNVTNVTNITNVNTTNQHFINQRAATSVPASAMQQSQNVAQLARPISAPQLATARPLQQAPVQPTLATRGVTPVVARSFNLQPVQGRAPVQQAAPGPAVTARPAGAVPLAPASQRGQAPNAQVTPASLPRPAGSAPVIPALRPAGGAATAAPGAAPGPVLTPRQTAPVAPRAPQAQGPAPAPGPVLTPRQTEPIVPRAPQAQAPAPGPGPVLTPRQTAPLAPRVPQAQGPAPAAGVATPAIRPLAPAAAPQPAAPRPAAPAAVEPPRAPAAVAAPAAPRPAAPAAVEPPRAPAAVAAPAAARPVPQAVARPAAPQPEAPRPAPVQPVQARPQAAPQAEHSAPPQQHPAPAAPAQAAPARPAPAAEHKVCPADHPHC